ncbi:MAG: cysteine desulfurase [Candidatus Micrarchaeales archaeon]
MLPRRIKEDFPILKRKINGKNFVYLDNAATSQKPIQVIEKIKEFYSYYNANIHRGIYKVAEEATQMYEESKEKVKDFINAREKSEIVYVRNTTEAINLVALSLGDKIIKKGDKILVSKMEHHSNLVPWQILAKRKRAKLEFVEVKDYNLDIFDYEKKVKNAKIVAITHVSNVLGTINDAKTLARIAHENGAIFLLDGAQSVPHMKVNVKNIDCDFLAFSGHKMLAPFGIGVLYGKREMLEEMEPLFGGGDMIKECTFLKCSWNELPYKFEAGTQNVEGAIGLSSAIDYLQRIGMEKIQKHEEELTKYALKRISEIKEVESYGPKKRSGIVSFNIKGIHAHDVASFFDKEGIAIRAGHHCAMPLVREVLKKEAVARISFYLYNFKEDVDRAIQAIQKLKKEFYK